MAKLTDLPDELLHRIIDDMINRFRDHTHDRLGEFRQRSRPHRMAFRSFDDGTLIRPGALRTDPETPFPVSWPEGLPRRPLVPLTLVNRKFRQCAQEALFKNVALKSQWQAQLFLQALTHQHPQPESGATHPPINTRIPAKLQEGGIECEQSSKINPSRQNQVARYVRSLQCRLRGPCSMGMGGGSVICDIIRSCPRLENIEMCTLFQNHCKEPIFQALASRRLIKDFVAYNHPGSAPVVVGWMVDEVVTCLFSKWDLLETVEIDKLSGRPIETIEAIHQSIPVLNFALKTLILNQPDLHEREILWILMSSRDSLRDLQISSPSLKLDRRGLYRILTEYTSPALHSLKIDVDANWHPIDPSRNGGSSDDPRLNPGLLDMIWRSSCNLSQLQSLYIKGQLAGSDFFTLLPQSIVSLKWDCDDLQGSALVRVLSRWGKNEKDQSAESLESQRDPHVDNNEHTEWLPNLKCCSCRSDTGWRSEDREAIEKALEARGVCYHSLYNELHPPPPPEGWAPSWAEMYMDMEGDMLEDDVLEDDVLEDDVLEDDVLEDDVLEDDVLEDDVLEEEL
ncbi:hypothetical protein PGT21_001530 [Puccinia graminis f. sp. tritici]|uniref:Uncharacterized protein n=1 Tax=Puccinia graminis f. sp. tritici TaxID=56615 RepID=A0A5B0LLB3_PUCGR|nr:hypothetical protein PGT21_001530 [Puccinia graminis f. sp. tritici]